MATLLKPTGCHRWAFVFALEREAAPFRRLRPDAHVLVTGVGAAAAANVVGHLIRTVRPAGVIVAGFAGALRPGLRVGDVVVAASVVDAVSGREFRLDHPGQAAAGRVVSADRILTDPAEKTTFGCCYDADAVDMESAAVAAVCEAAGVPCRCCRVVSDDASTRLPSHLASILGCQPGALATASRTPSLALRANTADRSNLVRAFRAVSRNPLLIRDLWRLGRDTRLAADRLAANLGAFQSDTVRVGLGTRLPQSASSRVG